MSQKILQKILITSMIFFMPSDIEIPEFWGITELRIHQQYVWDRLKNGESGLFIYPTGGGKSLIFQLWSHYHPQQRIVILTPLIALIDDHVRRAQALGLRAAGLHSAMSANKKQDILEQLSVGKIQLLFITPERFKSDIFRATLETLSIDLLVIDEAHLISQWGYDFRPDYRKIAQLIKHFSVRQVLALTATATKAVVEDIQANLMLPNFFVIQAPIVRFDLALAVDRVCGLDNKIDKIFYFEFEIPCIRVVRQ